MEIWYTWLAYFGLLFGMRVGWRNIEFSAERGSHLYLERGSSGMGPAGRRRFPGDSFHESRDGGPWIDRGGFGPENMG